MASHSPGVKADHFADAFDDVSAVAVWYPAALFVEHAFFDGHAFEHFRRDAVKRIHRVERRILRCLGVEVGAHSVLSLLAGPEALTTQVASLSEYLLRVVMRSGVCPVDAVDVEDEIASRACMVAQDVIDVAGGDE